MDGFFELLKGTGKAAYEFVLYIVTMLFSLSACVFVPMDLRPFVFFGLLVLCILCLSVGRIVTFLSILFMMGALGNQGYFNW